MPRARQNQDQAFWTVVKDLRWKLDDGRGGPPPAEPEFVHGGRPWRVPRILPSWISHSLAFAFGGLIVGTAFTTPVLAPVMALLGLIVMAGVSHWRDSS